MPAYGSSFLFTAASNSVWLHVACDVRERTSYWCSKTSTTGRNWRTWALILCGIDESNTLGLFPKGYAGSARSCIFWPVLKCFYGDGQFTRDHESILGVSTRIRRTHQYMYFECSTWLSESHSGTLTLRQHPLGRLSHNGRGGASVIILRGLYPWRSYRHKKKRLRCVVAPEIPVDGSCIVWGKISGALEAQDIEHWLPVQCPTAGRG